MLFRNCLWEYILKQGNPIRPSALLFSYCLVSKLHGIAESIWFSQGCLLLSRFDPPLRRLCKKLLNDSLCVFHRCEDPSSATYNPTTYCSAPVNTFSLLILHCCTLDSTTDISFSAQCRRIVLLNSWPESCFFWYYSAGSSVALLEAKQSGSQLSHRSTNHSQYTAAPTWTT